jgi:LmbE family N-acetylglucosaminyl deacetylase
MNVLVLAAHPDDETLGAGGTMARFVENGDRVHVLVACGMARVNIADDGRFADEKSSELQLAMRALGVTFECLGFPDQKLDVVPLVDLAAGIERAISQLRPETVLTHFSGDVNQDHRRVAEATMVACRAVPGSTVRRLASYFVPSSTDWGPPDRGFVPNAYQILDERHAQIKMRAMRCYASELRASPHPRSERGIMLALEHFGSRVSATYAEPFVVVRELF